MLAPCAAGCHWPGVTLQNALNKEGRESLFFSTAFRSVTVGLRLCFTRGGSSQFRYSLAWLGWALRKDKAMCFARSLICSWRRPLLRLRSDSQRQLELLRRLAAPRPQWNVALLQLGFALPPRQSGFALPSRSLPVLAQQLAAHPPEPRLAPPRPWMAAAASSAT